MRIALNSPIVTAVPGGHDTWEREAGIAELAEVAVAAERFGYDHLTCSEHVLVAREVAEQRGGTYWDPLATFGFLAASTSRIRLATQVLVLGYHHPLEIAKRYGTLDRVSGGRLVLGLGVGSLREEFDVLGAQFEGRGAIADDALRAVRASLSCREPVYRGEHYSFDDVVVDPWAAQDRVPLWVGGRSRRSLRRAVELGDGWVPFGLAADDLRTMLDAVDLAEGFQVVLSPAVPLDPIGDPVATRAAVVPLAEAGATIVSVKLVATSLPHYLEQIEAMARIASEV